MTEWKINKRGEACAFCERAFVEGEAHISSLALDADAVTRFDACLACWKKRDSSSDLFWWRTRRSADKPRGLALNLEALEGLFVSLSDRSETSLRELRYVLCLILMRKRRLKIERVARTEHGEALIVTRPRRRDVFEVDVFDFTPEQIDALRSRLQDVFEQSDALGAEAQAERGADERSEEAAAHEDVTGSEPRASVATPARDASAARR